MYSYRPEVPSSSHGVLCFCVVCVCVCCHDVVCACFLHASPFAQSISTKGIEIAYKIQNCDRN
jgi:hypothetical protein